jgi:hypothetical protein
MKMRMVVPDVAGATSLATRLTIAFGSKCIFVGGKSREVAVLIDEPDSSIERVVDAVERWFRHGQVATVEMSLGKRSYNLAQWLPAEARR